MISIELPYATGTISVPLPGGMAPGTAPCIFPEPFHDISRSIEDALENPEGCAALSDLIPPSGPIAVLVSDLTRGRAAASTLIPALEYLEKHGAGPNRTTIYIASGMHRGQSVSEIESHLGKPVACRYRIVQHDARDRISLVETGTTSRGTYCLFNKDVAGSSLVIGIGAVSFHYFAGFGGGRKLILPGISGEETILANQRRSLREDPSDGLSEGCEPGVLDGNPVHEDMVEGASTLPAKVFMVCAVAGAGGEPAFVSAGDMDRAHCVAAAWLRERCTLTLERRHRVVIASAGGYPKDINLLQAHKAIRHASLAVEDGGLLLMAAACPEGIGSGSLEDDFSGGRAKVPERISRRYTLNSQAAISIHEITGRIEVRIVSELPVENLTRFGFGSWKVEETYSLLEGIPAGEVLIIPHAASFLPVIE